MDYDEIIQKYPGAIIFEENDYKIPITAIFQSLTRKFQTISYMAIIQKQDGFFEQTTQNQVHFNLDLQNLTTNFDISDSLKQTILSDNCPISQIFHFIFFQNDSQQNKFNIIQPPSYFQLDPIPQEFQLRSLAFSQLEFLDFQAEIHENSDDEQEILMCQRRLKNTYEEIQIVETQDQSVLSEAKKMLKQKKKQYLIKKEQEYLNFLLSLKKK